METVIIKASQEFLVLSLIFGVLGFCVFGKKIFANAVTVKREFYTNLTYYILDLIIHPILWGVMLIGFKRIFEYYAIGAIIKFDVAQTSPFLLLILAVMLSDFVGYWRHRVMHLPLLWPVHAAHHSDTQLSWLSLMRFHPINRLVTASLDFILFALLGFPIEIIIANNLFRHYYGYFVHANLPIHFGFLSKIFVDPIFHRWHHAADPAAYGSNFATVFALYDYMFGTWYYPHKNVGELGITSHPYPDNWAGQMIYPFKVWGKKLAVLRKKEQRVKP